MSHTRDELRPLRPLLVSTLVSSTGDGMLAVGAPLLAASLTSDPMAVSMITAAVWGPSLTIGLFSGALADRWPRVQAMIFADISSAAFLVLLVVMIAVGYGNAYMVACGVFAVSCAQCLFDAAAQSQIPAALGRDEKLLNHANARYWALDSTGRKFAGPLAGSALFVAGHALPLIADAISFAISAAAIRKMPRREMRRQTPKKPILSEIRTGLSFVTRTPALLRIAWAYSALNGAWACNTAVLVLFCRGNLHMTTIGYGLLLTCQALGRLTTWRFPERLLHNRPPHRVYALIMCLSALMWLTIGLAQSGWVAAICLTVTGYNGGIATVVSNTLRQKTVPDHMQGRVMSVLWIPGVGSAALGAIAGGAIASALGLTATFLISASLLATAALAMSASEALFGKSAALARPDAAEIAH